MSRLLLFQFGLFVEILLLPSTMQAQFIANDQDKGTYQNYSGRNYENYSSTLLRRKFYDNFGNFLVDGVSVFDLNEEQRPYTSIYDLPLSNLTKTRFYFSYFSNLVILNDSYSGLTSRLMVGDAIRTKFTSLTLDKARFNGVRWDAATNKYRATVLASRESDPIRFSPEGVFNPQATIRLREWTDYLLGGHFETDIGDVLTLGATYINQHQRKSTLDSKQSSFEGVPANAVPRVIFVRLVDDTPGDNSGPIIYGPPRIYLNGQSQPAPMTNINGRVPDAFKTDISSPIQYWVISDYQILYTAAGGVGSFGTRDTTSQTQYVNYRDLSARYPQPRYPYQLVSDRLELQHNVTYAYVIPQGVYSVDFSVVLANDFRVDANHDWINNVDDFPNPSNPTRFRSHADSLLSDPVPVPTIWRTMARAEGNVKDGSNRQVVRFSYGLVTGMAVYGLNFKFDYAGFKIEGEYARSVEYLKYPMSTLRSAEFLHSQGVADNRFESPGEAFFIRGTKKIGRVTFGAERYRMDPHYTTMFAHYTMDNSFYGDQNSMYSLLNPYYIPDFLGFDPSAGSATSTMDMYLPGRAGGAAFSLVDDNDDNDRWEDGFYYYNVEALPDMRNGDVLNWDYTTNTGSTRIRNPEQPFRLGYRENWNELTGLADIIRKPDAGIFPGRDKDHDGIPDDDRNSDGIPDYTQDFLTYYVDPPFFLYGDDWNNNGVIDEQENDILPDYPYNPDLDGYHLFGSIELMRNMNLRIGTIREHAMAYGGKNYADYARWSYEAGTPRFGSMNLFYVHKRVQDNIPNNGYQFTEELTILSPIPTFTFDSLEYKNSVVNQLYLGTIYTQIPDVHIENNVRLEFNDQSAVGLGLRDKYGKFLNPDDQLDGRLVKIGLVNKIDYVYSLFNNKLHLIPQLKVRTQKVVKDQIYRQEFYGAGGTFIRRDSLVTFVTVHRQEIIPIFRIEYELTERTNLHIGFQGFDIPGTNKVFTYQIRNIRDPQFDENRTTVAVSLSNRSSYGGYNVVVDVGYKRTVRQFPRTVDIAQRDREESLIYMSIYAGF